jgi:ketosteroid isomerase-like protein
MSRSSPTADDPRSTVERYYATVADLQASPEELRALLDPQLRVVEHPNAIHPQGTVRDRDAVVAAYEEGKGMLSEQVFELEELLVSGDRVSVRAVWRGRLAGGARLEARIAAFLTVVDGRIREHETYDCYAPIDRD